MALLLDAPAVSWPASRAGVVRVTGTDRLTYLHTLLSQHLEAASTGTVADFLYLDAKGNALAEGRAIVGVEQVWLLTAAEVAADLADALERYKFLLQVDAADVSAEFGMAALRGPDAELPHLPGAPETAMTATVDGSVVTVRDRSGGVDLLGPTEAVEARVAALGLPTASAGEWEAWRIRAGQPGWGTEVRAGRRAQELGLLPTHVHLRKGCYPGQESIAKIYNLGRPRRALAVVQLEAPVVPGDPVAAGGKSGEVTSAAAAGSVWLALALLPVGSDGEVLGDGRVVAGEAPGRVLARVGQGLVQPGA